MKTEHSCAGLLFLLLLLVAAPGTRAQPLPVFVEAEEVGQGILLQRMGICYGITPAHVIDGGFFATLVAGLPTAPRGEGDVLITFGYDLSLLRVTGGVTEHCNSAFVKSASLDTLFSSASVAHLHTVRSDGSVARQQVSIADTGMLYVHVRPLAEGEPLMKGMSGSMLEMAGKPVGMLMSVDAQAGQGKVLRYDRLTETIAPFFSGRKPDTPITDTIGRSGGNEPSGKAVVASWSASPLGADTRAANLLDGNTATQWVARVQRFPIDLEIELASGQSVVVNGVELVSEGILPEQRTPRDYEIMVSNRAGGGWLPVASGTIFAKDKITVAHFAPVRAKRVLLRIHSNWGDTDATGLSEIRIR